MMLVTGLASPALMPLIPIVVGRQDLVRSLLNPLPIRSISMCYFLIVRYMWLLNNLPLEVVLVHATAPRQVLVAHTVPLRALTIRILHIVRDIIWRIVSLGIKGDRVLVIIEVEILIDLLSDVEIARHDKSVIALERPRQVLYKWLLF